MAIINSMKMKRIARYIKPEIAAVLAAAFILIYVLMPVPVIGVADNGDFARIMSSVCLAHMTDEYTDNYFGYVSRQFRIVSSIPFPGGYFSTEIPIVAAAVMLCRSVSGSGIFDIRYLSAIYSIMFLISLYLIIKYCRVKAGNAAAWILAVLGVFVFADMGYISYFNSLYGEAVSVIFLLFSAGMVMWITSAKKPEIYMLLIFFAGMLMFAGAKVQNSPLGLVAAVYGLAILKLRPDRLWRKIVVSSVALLVAVSCFSYFTVSRDIKVCNKYQTVFYGILKDSPDPAADLRELGLDTDLAVLAGTNYFMESYPIDIRSASFKQELYNSVSHLKIAGFYLRHPDRFLKKLEVSANNGFKLKQGFGNYEKAPGIEYRQAAKRFSFWSNFKLAVLPHSLIFITIVFLLFFLAVILGFVRAKDINSRLLFGFFGYIGVTGLTQFMLPVIGDGEADLSKHLFLFNVSFDMAAVTLIVLLAAAVAGLVRSIASQRIIR